MPPKRYRLPCPKCTSSDAYHEWEDHGYCFSCNYYVKFNQEFDISDEDFTYQYVPWRGITRETMEFYDVRTKVNNAGSPVSVGFPYQNGRVQVRLRDKKDFYFTGERTNETGNLFGLNRFAPGSAKAITICEGAIDALSVFQIMGSKYPVVSVLSASTAKKDCSVDWEYLNSFDRIYLCFDNDEPGIKAANDVARLFDFNKVYHVKLPVNGTEKDPNDYLVHEKSKEFYSLWWNAKRFLPEGIISSYAEIDKIIDEDGEKPAVPYPFQRLQQMTYGIRSGEFVLLKAMEGIGKTEIIRAFEYHLLKTTDANIGIIHLEESKPRSIKGLVGYEIKAPIHLPDQQIPKQEIKTIFRKLTGRDDRVHIYSHFGSDDPDTILNTIRFLAGPCNCKYVFLDHITMVVTGLQGEDERRALDYISTRLAMMVEELDFTLFCVSHVNDEGQTRGSRNIAKVCDLNIDLYRDKLAESEDERNTTYLTIEKNRYAGKTGPAGRLKFDPETYVLEEEIVLPGT